MKYWVYKDARIAGPFDREVLEGLPGVDAATLVCGDGSGGAEGDWRPAAELAGLSVGAAAAFVSPDGEGEPLGTQDLLDRLQIEAAGLVEDGDFPAGGLAEELFQDAGLKKSFSDLLAPRPPADDSELRRSRERVEELTMQVEELHRRLNGLEDSRAQLLHRLAEREVELSRRAHEAPILPPAVPAPAAAISPRAEPSAPPAPPARPPAAEGSAPPERALPPPPTRAPMAAASGAAAPEEPRAPELPAEQSSTAPAVLFRKKTFKGVFTRKPLREISREEPEPVPAEASSPAAPPPPPAAAPEPEGAPEAPFRLAPAPEQRFPPGMEPAPPALAAKREGASSSPERAALPPAPFFAAEKAAAPAAEPSPAPAASAAEPPQTLRFSPPPEFPPFPGDSLEPAAEGPGAAASDELLSRLSKPEADEAAPAPARSRGRKAYFLLALAAVAAVAAIGMFLFRNPKQMRDMAALDDGRARVGALDDTASLGAAVTGAGVSPAPAPGIDPLAAMSQPPQAASGAPSAAPEAAAASAALPAPRPGGGAELQTAVDLVKNFPLHGDRGTIGRWLAYSYTASPGAGREDWTASYLGEKSYLVEYRLAPGPRDSRPPVVYMFEADMGLRLVVGKNEEARRMLSGGGGEAAAPVRRAPRRKAASSRPRKRAETARPVAEDQAAPRGEEGLVPLLPLPEDSELRPPSGARDE